MPLFTGSSWHSQEDHGHSHYDFEGIRNEDDEDDDDAYDLEDDSMEEISERFSRLHFSGVLAEEQETLRKKGASRRIRDGTSFSLAFSGGGVRAAAFQAGVLWHLARIGLLKHVDYLSAVSGGGWFAASFVSHVLGAERPNDLVGENLDAWYLDVVARTICRIQRYPSLAVRDIAADPWGSTHDGAGNCPRWCDVPLLVVTLLVTMATNPVIVIVLLLIPSVEYINLFFGSGMRAAFCAPPSMAGRVLQEYSALASFKGSIMFVFALLFFTYVGQKLFPCCRVGPAREKGRYRSSRVVGCLYLPIRSSLAFLSRFLLVLVIWYVLILLVSLAQSFDYEHSGREQVRRDLCQAFVDGRGVSEIGAHTSQTCSDVLTSPAWWQDPLFTNTTVLNDTLQQQIMNLPVHHTNTTLFQLFAEFDQTFTKLLKINGWRIDGLVFAMLVIFLLIGCLCSPLVGVHLLRWTFFLIVPLIFAVTAMNLLQYRVYGPLTKQTLLGQPFSEELWNFIVICSFAIDIILVLFYHMLTTIWHRYFLRTLQGNFFDNGEDNQLHDISEDDLCPLLLLSSTVNDFKRSDDLRGSSISEIIFSPLHSGGEKTGYIRTPEHYSLAKCAALTGAAFLDTAVLSMNDAIKCRFFLSCCNLNWGDYMIFEDREDALLQRLRGERDWSWQESYKWTWAIRQCPSKSIWTCVIAMWIGSFIIGMHPSHRTCNTMLAIFASASFMVLLVVWLSFYTSDSRFECLMFSIPLRQWAHQNTRHYVRATSPPKLLYMTDGGVRDCTTLVALMRRRSKRILLVLAAADAFDELGVLRCAIAIAKEEKLGYLFPFDDPTCCIDLYFEKFQAEIDTPYLKLGIQYGWDEPGEKGLLVVVKNRLPSEFRDQAIKPLLAEEEICGDREAVGSSLSDDWLDLSQDDLGGVGCCDCCHVRGCNCGPKFPHLGPTAYVYLTPQLFNSICRLGNDVSGPAIEAVTSTCF